MHPPKDILGHLTQVPVDVAVFGNRIITVAWGEIWLEVSFKGDMWAQIEVEDYWGKMHKGQGCVCQPRIAKLPVTLEEWLKKAAWTKKSCPGGVLTAAM